MYMKFIYSETLGFLLSDFMFSWFTFTFTFFPKFALHVSWGMAV